MNQPDYRQQQEAEEYQQWYEQDRILLDQIAEVSAGMIAEGKAWNERMNELRKPLVGRLPTTTTGKGN